MVVLCGTNVQYLEDVILDMTICNLLGLPKVLILYCVKKINNMVTFRKHNLCFSKVNCVLSIIIYMLLQ